MNNGNIVSDFVMRMLKKCRKILQGNDVEGKILAKKLLIVGGFPPPGKNVYGGVVRSCELHVNSQLKDQFSIIKFDSSQISVPAPSFFIKAILSAKKHAVLLWLLLIARPSAALLFLSSGTSALEKGNFILLCRIFGVRCLIFPRAGRLIDEYNHHYFFRKFVHWSFNKADRFLCQGRGWQKFALEQLGFPLIQFFQSQTDRYR